MQMRCPTRNVLGRRGRRGRRGAALTELVILLFPYCILMIGVLTTGFFALGRQEAQKAAILVGPVPGQQDLAYISQHAFATQGGARHSFSAVEEVDPFLEQSYSDEEPVLPYREADDIHAGFVRIENPRARVNTSHMLALLEGGVDPVDAMEASLTMVRTSEGRYLNDMQIMSADQGGTEGREEDVRTLLGDWLTYSKTRVDYSFTYGGGRLPLEEDTNRDLRETFTLRGLDGEKGLVYFSGARTGQDHGSYQTGVPVTFTEFSTLDSAADSITGESTTLNIDGLPKPYLTAEFSAEEEEAFFEILSSDIYAELITQSSGP